MIVAAPLVDKRQRGNLLERGFGWRRKGNWEGTTMTQKDDGIEVAISRKVPKVTISLKYIYLAQIKYIIFSGIYGIGSNF
jgi:hypothetical protein